MGDYVTFNRDTWLHILRNPYGWERETVEGARRWAGEEIHQLDVEINRLRASLEQAERERDEARALLREFERTLIDDGEEHTDVYKRVVCHLRGESETTQEERDNMRRLWTTAPDIGTQDLVLRALNDADRLAAIERQVLWRDKIDAPEWATLWVKSDVDILYRRKNVPDDGPHYWTDGLGNYAHAPDLFPNVTPQEGGSFSVPILDPPEE